MLRHGSLSCIFSIHPLSYFGKNLSANSRRKTIFRGAANDHWRLLPTRANGTTAFGLYRIGEQPGLYQAYGIQVVRWQGTAIADITTFRVPGLFARFGLPMSLGDTAQA